MRVWNGGCLGQLESTCFLGDVYLLVAVAAEGVDESLSYVLLLIIYII